jgi:phosphoenolpyruvate carboxykinase (GTP)
VGRISLQEEAYKKEKKLPPRILEVYDEQKKGLLALKEKFGSIVKPEALERA